MTPDAWLTITWIGTEAVAFWCGALWMRHRLVSRLADHLFEEEAAKAISSWRADGFRTYTLEEARAALDETTNQEGAAPP